MVAVGRLAAHLVASPERPARLSTQPPHLDADRNASDLLLIERLVRRDHEALDLLYDRYADAVYGLSLRVLKDPGDAQQVLTDVFFELWEKAEKFHPDRGSLRSYLMLLARSRAIDSLRRKRRTGRVEGATLQHGLSGQTTEDEPDAALIDDEEAQAVRRALAGLPELERKALEMAFFDGMTHAEISQETETPLGTIKSRIRRGLVRMRDRVAGFYHHDGPDEPDEGGDDV